MKTALVFLAFFLPVCLSAQVVINGSNTQMNPNGVAGSYGNREGEPCEQGKTEITWRWHKTFACSIDKTAIVGCGTVPGASDLISKAKEFVEKSARWGGKVLKYIEAIAKTSSLVKTYDIYVHVIQAWTDYDVTYRCVNGKWSSVGAKVVGTGSTDLGWRKVRKTSDATCWTGAESEAELAEATKAVLAGCPW